MPRPRSTPKLAIVSGRKVVTTVLVCLAAAGALFAAEELPNPGEAACLEQGGLWFGEVGCEMAERRIDRVVIDKSERRLTAFEDGRPVRTFIVALGGDPVGPKQRQGDERTPEGVYPVVAHKPDSAFHRALRLGYPTPEQAEMAAAAGVDPGGDIMIHGLPNGQGWIGAAHRESDWTLGCIAVTDDEIEWLYRFVADGTPVEIRA